MKKLLVLLLSLYALIIPAKASDYVNYCANAVELLINTLGVPDDFLVKNSIVLNAEIKPDGTVKKVKVVMLGSKHPVRLSEWEEQISKLRFPAHNSFGASSNKPIVISQRLVRMGTRDVMQGYEFVGSLRSAITAGFRFHRPFLYLKAKVAYTIDRDANLVSFHITQSSGCDAFDNAVEKHLEKRQKEKLLYLPQHYRGDTFKDTVSFTSK